MRISLNWLSDYIRIPFTPDELAERLTMLGLEIDAIERPGERMDKVVVGEVVELTPHPNADKLRLARVSVGAETPLRIVCGAPNVAVGQKVPVALIGADLGEGFIIKKSKIRGETSEGMICSERELGISEKHEGIWVLPRELAVGSNLAVALGLNDTVFEIGITPNRADCLSHIGIAREVRAITGEKLTLPAPTIANIGGALANEVRISLPQPDLCPRYVAKMIRGVTVRPSPEWLQRRLEAVGLRPRNNVVDVTNFVLMECGHPLHAFDFDTVEKGEIVVRTAAGFATEYVTLDGKTRKLPSDALLITDGKKPLGIAGIMGGENSEIRDTTTNVLIESAYFNPSSIRRTAKQMGLSTDASYRFERGTNFDVLMGAAERAAHMIVELGGGEIVEGLIDKYPTALVHKEFKFRPSRADLLLGFAVPRQRMQEVFARLDIELEQMNEDLWELHIPSYRVDLEREEDAIEEIARVVGYDQIPISTFERAPLTGLRDPLKRKEFDEILRSTLLALGAIECVSVPLVSAKDAKNFHEHPVELINPLNEEKDRMRSSIAINLLDAARHNQRFGAQGQRLFETGNVFHYSSSPEALGNVKQGAELGVLITGVQEPKTAYNATSIGADIQMMKGLTEALAARAGIGPLRYEVSSERYLEPNESLGVCAGEIRIGNIGRLSAAVSKEYDLRQNAWIGLFDYELLFQLARNARLKPKQVNPLPKYPSVERDIALVLKSDVTARSVEECIHSASPSKLLQSVRLFDEFRSPEMKTMGERSLALNLVFRSEDRTLEEREVDDLIFLIIKRLESELHARLRV